MRTGYATVLTDVLTSKPQPQWTFLTIVGDAEHQWAYNPPPGGTLPPGLTVAYDQVQGFWAYSIQYDFQYSSMAYLLLRHQLEGAHWTVDQAPMRFA